MNHPKVEIYQENPEWVRSHVDEDPPGWRWRLKAGNGEIVATGESYGSPRDAERGFRDAASSILILVNNALEFGANWKIEVIAD
jgi:hypothetical protein